MNSTTINSRRRYRLIDLFAGGRGTLVLKVVRREMNYRKLTEKEIRLFIEEHARYERWACYKVYALYVYGSQAVRVVVESGNDYRNSKTKKVSLQLVFMIRMAKNWSLTGQMGGGNH